MTDINHEKLQVMLKEWRGVLEERMRVMARLRNDLERLRETDKKADVDSVLAFYESVRISSMAAGKVELLDELVSASAPAVGIGPADNGFHL